MIKENKKLLAITSIVILIPMLIGLLLWNRLPEQIPSHWDINGNIDNWSSKSFVVFGLPAMLLGLHWLCVIASAADPKHKNYSKKMLLTVLWICPIIGLFLFSLVYATALGYPIKVEIIMPLLVGLMFIIVGNLLPKCRQTYTMGIKLPWTFASEKNWNKTHRFAGKIWVMGGIVTMATAFLSNFWMLFFILIVMVAAPTAYSYLYYRKHGQDQKEA